MRTYSHIQLNFIFHRLISWKHYLYSKFLIHTWRTIISDLVLEDRKGDAGRTKKINLAPNVMYILITSMPNLSISYSALVCPSIYFKQHQASISFYTFHGIFIIYVPSCIIHSYSTMLKCYFQSLLLKLHIQQCFLATFNKFLDICMVVKTLTRNFQRIYTYKYRYM